MKDVLEKLKRFQEVLRSLANQKHSGEVILTVKVNFNDGNITKCKAKLEKSV